MPCDPDAVEVFRDNKVFHAPGKAANAGGVAVSGLEMAQNSMKIAWTREEVDDTASDLDVQLEGRQFDSFEDALEDTAQLVQKLRQRLQIKQELEVSQRELNVQEEEYGELLRSLSS